MKPFGGINTTLADDLLIEIMKQPPTFFEHLVVERLTQMGYGGSVDECTARSSGKPVMKALMVSFVKTNLASA